MNVKHTIRTSYTRSPEISRKWYIIDAATQPLGRVASEAAFILQGKHKGSFTPHIDDGDFVVVINAYKFSLSGRKVHTKVYKRHSGYVGGLKEVSHQLMMQKKPWFPLEKAIHGMLPKNRLARQMFKKLILLEGSDLSGIPTVSIVKHKI